MVHIWQGIKDQVYYYIAWCYMNGSFNQTTAIFKYSKNQLPKAKAYLGKLAPYYFDSA